MSLPFMRILVSVNRVLTTINGFIFGILIQFSPLHSRKNKIVRIPLPINVALLMVLLVILFLLLGAYGPAGSQMLPAYI
jgi:hypothetical protein